MVGLGLLLGEIRIIAVHDHQQQKRELECLYGGASVQEAYKGDGCLLGELDPKDRDQRG